MYAYRIDTFAQGKNDYGWSGRPVKVTLLLVDIGVEIGVKVAVTFARPSESDSHI